MNFKWHSIITTTVFIIIYLFLTKIGITDVIWAIILGTVFPDLDHKFKKHRHFLSHSIFLPFTILIFNFDPINLTILLGIGLHCLCDMKVRNRQGTYCAYIKKGNRMNANTSTMWYLVNGIVAIVTFFVCYVFLL